MNLLFDCCVLDLLKSVSLPLLFLGLQLLLLLRALQVLLLLCSGRTSSSLSLCGLSLGQSRLLLLPLVFGFLYLSPFLLFYLGSPLQLILARSRSLNLWEDPVQRCYLAHVSSLQKPPVDYSFPLPLVPGLQSVDELV